MKWAAIALTVLFCGCGPVHQSRVLDELQKEYGSDKITVVKWFGTLKDTDCDLTDDEDWMKFAKSIRPFTVTRLQYRVANKIGQQELHDEMIAVGEKSGWCSVRTEGAKADERLSKILDRL